MENDRFNPPISQRAYFALLAPIGFTMAFLFAPCALIVLASFFGTLWLFWHFVRLFSIWLVATFGDG